ncbi:MAG TPA: OstA-like protein [Candidatus Elarobacter sp.]|jgi:lipopolysaccharide export system protein LptA|nr:OstA-like protein [Candidatus Elarobacter sp.]
MPARRTLAGLAVIVFCAAAAASPAPVVHPSMAPVPSAPAPAASGSPPAASTSSAALDTPFYRLQTDEITLKGNGDFTMPHHVTFSRPGSDGSADRAEGNRTRGTATLVGNVVIHDNGKAPEAGDDEYAKGGPSTLTCDKLDVDSKARIYNAFGHVHFEQGDRKMSADHAVLNRGTGMLHLEGDVKTSEGGSALSADVLDYNLNTKRVAANGRPVMIKQPVPTPEPGSVTPSPKPKKRRLPFP